MASEYKEVKKPRNIGKAYNYFIKSRLYRLLYVDRVSDECLVWDYESEQKKILVYSQFKRDRERAYTLPEVAGMVGRRYDYMVELRNSGELAIFGAKAVPMGGTGKRIHWYYSKDDVLRIHDFFARRGRGRRRKNGTWRVPKGMTPRDEVVAALNEGSMRFIKRDGEFIPVFKEK